MHMNLFSNITVTEIERPYIVYFRKDHSVQMKDRQWFGIAFCTSGQLTYTMGDKQIVSRPGSAILLPMGGTYHIHGDKEGYFPLINFRCEGLPIKEIITIPLSNPKSCIRDFDTLRNLYLLGDNRLKIFGIFYELLSKLSLLHSSVPSPLRSAITFLEENLTDPNLTNIEIATHAGISEVYLRKLFAQHYNTTPKQYILELRIQKAILLLTEYPASVTEVAEKCGFSSVYHFSRVFKNRTGIQPSQYSLQHSVQNI